MKNPTTNPKLKTGLRLCAGLSCCAVALALAGNASAQDFFDGGTANPGDWNDPVNWNNDTLPGVGNNPNVGEVNVPTATANITGPLTNPNINDLRIGNGAGGALNANGTVNMSAGSLKASGWAFIGVDGVAGNAAVGTLNLSGTAQFEVDILANGGAQEFHVGSFGGANAGNQGFVTVSDNASLTIPRGYIGQNDGNFGTLTQSGGSVTANDWLSIGRDGGATGLYNMTGGSLTVVNDGLTVGENNGATGTMNVSGSSIIATPLLNVGRFGGGAQGFFNISGSSASITASTALNVGIDSGNAQDATGTLDFTADAGGVSAIFANDVNLNDGTIIGAANLLVDMSLAPAGDILLVDVGGTLTGTFAGLANGAAVPGSGGRFISYSSGDGNDIWLTTVPVPEPTTVALVMLGAATVLTLRRQKD